MSGATPAPARSASPPPPAASVVAVPGATAAANAAAAPAVAPANPPPRRAAVPWLRLVVLVAFFTFLLVPLYWMVNSSFKTNQEILDTSRRTFVPATATLDNYRRILFGTEVEGAAGAEDRRWIRSEWVWSFIHSFWYVAVNVLVVIVAAVPAAYAFSRWRFRGDRHLFFWLLTNRMAPGAVFMLPMLSIYGSIGLFGTPWAVALAHCLFNLPLAIWILEGFMSGIPKELDETAFIDGMGFGRFFVKIFLPLIKPGIGVAAFFCFLFSWTEMLLARTLTDDASKPIVVKLTSSCGAEGWDWGLLTAAGVLTMIPGVVMVYFIRNYIAKGFAMGRV